MADQAKRNGQATEWEMIACGLWDGMRGSFGRPSTPLAGATVRARMRLWELRRPVDRWLLDRSLLRMVTSAKARAGRIRRERIGASDASSGPRRGSTLTAVAMYDDNTADHGALVFRADQPG